MNTIKGSRSCPKMVKRTYEKMEANLKIIRARSPRPLTLAEKVLYGHLRDPHRQEMIRGASYLSLQPDRIAMHDISGQMAILQFMTAEKDSAAVPTTIHCDHLIRAERGSTSDLVQAKDENDEIYRFLETASSRYKLGFWKPGSGIIHQVLLENYAFPGGLFIGTDSHTSNAGGLGTLASGVGGSDAADVMAGLAWEVKNPKLIGVHLTGQLNGWASPKDVILKLCGMLSTKGGTDKVIEYFGEGTSSISCTGKATITNMGAELGATSSIFPFDERMAAYLVATGREDLAELARRHAHLLRADNEVAASPHKFYDEVYEIDLSRLEPHVVGPHSPDIAWPISKLAKAAKENGWPVRLSSALIGSCTNSSYEDIGKAAHVASQALAKGVRMPQKFFITPGSSRILDTIERDGMMRTLTDVGATVLANACGPCIGQWKRPESGVKNTILTTFNRNFRGRNDSNTETLAFIGSPAIVMALGLAGRLDFNPLVDPIATPNGPLFLKAPEAAELPDKGFVNNIAGFQPPVVPSKEISVDPNSKRLRLLESFDPWSGKDLTQLRILAKIAGKCTTDHISPAGPWLRYRGHLPNISANLLQRATNSFTGEVGKGTNELTGEQHVDLALIAEQYKKSGLGWVLFADENYGEGSSREQAAMSPRFLGCRAIIAKSFARIHETNLKKQGVLALTFERWEDSDKIRSGDQINLRGLAGLTPGVPVKMEIIHRDGSSESILLNHSYTQEHIEWFRAGSALNVVRGRAAGK